MRYRAVQRGVTYEEGEPAVHFESIYDRWNNDNIWRRQKTQQGWTEELIHQADEEAVRECEPNPMSREQREKLCPTHVLRQSKVGGNSIKKTDHPTYFQAWDNYPTNTGAGSSNDVAPWRETRHDAHHQWDDIEKDDADEDDYQYSYHRRW